MFVWKVFPGRADARPGAFLAMPALERAGIRAAFTNRTGGTSERPFDSLNLSFFSGDEAGRVRANRARALAAVGAPADAWTNGRQVHGTVVARVDEGDRGAGAFDPDTALQGVDGLWTEAPGVALAVLGADCLPVLLADPRRRRIAAVHAGWRGLVAGVLETAATGMTDGAGTTSELQAFVGPSIGPCCYEVGEDLASDAREALGAAATAMRGERTHLDLWTGARISLARAGVRDVWLAGLCTRCEPHRFYSHRAGSAGRQGLVAMLA